MSTARVTVETPAGPITGISADGVDAFLGIRYAQAPTGPLRFRPPQPIESSGHPTEATAFGGRCHQQGPGVDVIFPDLEVHGDEGEDCLFVNVYAPSRNSGDRAVLVWIHGGAFINGSGNDYDPSRIVAEHDVVVVTVGYRLGVFGFLDLSRLGDEFAGTANLGIQDQIAALQWVRQNIGAFGGDGDNVTIWGESAGGASVHALLGAPAAHGLFHKAMPFSGAETLTPPLDQLSVISAVLGAASDQDCLERLMAMTSVELAELQANSGFYAGTSIDGVVITRPSCEAIVDGGAAAIPILTGTTKDEGTFLAPHYDLGDEVLLAILFGLSMSIGRDDGAAYRAWLDAEIGLADPLRCLERAWFDCFRASAVRVAATASLHGAGGWVYDFEVKTDHPLGVTHFADVPFTFNWVPDGPPREFTHPPTRTNVAVADAWSATLVEFAKTGLPSGRGLPEWPKYSPEDLQSMRVRHEPQVVENPDGDMISVYQVPTV